MSTVRGPTVVRKHPRMVTLLLTIIGYVIVIGTLYVGLPIYPTITERTVDLLSHSIAVINTVTVITLALGWYWIRNGEVDKHRIAMSLAFFLILVFLVLYLLKTGGGGRKDILPGAPLRTAYLAMLGIHIFLSVIAVPLVIYAITLGITRTPRELRSTPHAQIGRVAVTSWLVSLILGIVTYGMLTYYYSPDHIEFVRMMIHSAGFGL